MLRESGARKYAPVLRDALVADAGAALDAYVKTGALVVGYEWVEQAMRTMCDDLFVVWAEHEYSAQTKGFVDMLRDMWRHAGGRYFDRVGRKKAALAAETTQRDLSGLLAEAARTNEGQAAIAIAVRRMMPGFFEHRADRIAGTESVALSEAGRLRGAMAAGATRKIWLTTLDARTRRGERGYDHAAVNMQERDLAVPFTVDGEALMHPGDISMGARAGNVINCRCATIFV